MRRLSLKDVLTNTAAMRAVVVATHAMATPAARAAAGAAACTVKGSAAGASSLRADTPATSPAAGAAWLRVVCRNINRGTWHPAFVATLAAVLAPKMAAAVPADLAAGLAPELAVGIIVACRGVQRSRHVTTYHNLSQKLKQLTSLWQYRQILVKPRFGQSSQIPLNHSAPFHWLAPSSSLNPPNGTRLPEKLNKARIWSDL